MKLSLKLLRFWNYGSMLRNIFNIKSKIQENTDSDIHGSIQTLSHEFCVDGENVIITHHVIEYSIIKLLWDHPNSCMSMQKWWGMTTLISSMLLGCWFGGRDSCIVIAIFSKFAQFFRVVLVVIQTKNLSIKLFKFKKVID